MLNKNAIKLFHHFLEWSKCLDMFFFVMNNKLLSFIQANNDSLEKKTTNWQVDQKKDYVFKIFDTNFGECIRTWTSYSGYVNAR